MGSILVFNEYSGLKSPTFECVRESVRERKKVQQNKSGGVFSHIVSYSRNFSINSSGNEIFWVFQIICANCTRRQKCQIGTLLSFG